MLLVNKLIFTLFAVFNFSQKNFVYPVDKILPFGRLNIFSRPLEIIFLLQSRC